MIEHAEIQAALAALREETGKQYLLRRRLISKNGEKNPSARKIFLIQDEKKTYAVLRISDKELFPKNMKMTISRIADLYPDKDEYEKAVNDNLEKLQEEYSSGQLNIDAMLIMSELNVKLDGKEDWTGLSEQEKKDKYVLGALLHHAYTAIPKRRGFVRGEDKIVIFTTPLPNIIAIGTTKTSVTKFWTGMGVLEEREDGYRDRILSPKQWEESQENIKKTVPSDLLSMKNFKKIKISEPLNFTS